MAVGLIPIEEKTILPVMGVTLGCAKAGIRKPDRLDLAVIQFCAGTEVAGVFTLNQFCAAPVLVCKERLGNAVPVRAFCINTGVANAGTGEKGVREAIEVCDQAATLLGVNKEAVLPFSTGVIMEHFPVEKMISALPECLNNLRLDGWVEAAHAIMTTDTMAKAASRQCTIDGQIVTITGIAKGSGMICPNMATMLGFIATDARISQPVLTHLIRDVANQSFNLITVDGDTSTNDSLMIAATQQADHRAITSIDSEDYQRLFQAVKDVALELAISIVRDGEGATKLVTILVTDALTEQEAHQVAKAVAHSPLLKTAFFASDPNLGRILSAIGNSKIDSLDAHLVKVWLDDVLIAEHGGRAACYQEIEGQRVMAQEEIKVKISLNRGTASSCCYTCDLSYEYVRINADYRS